MSMRAQLDRSLGPEQVWGAGDSPLGPEPVERDRKVSPGCLASAPGELPSDQARPVGPNHAATQAVHGLDLQAQPLRGTPL